MIKRSYKVLRANGISSKLYLEMVSLANKYKSEMSIITKDENANLKSVINTMSIIIKENDEFSIEITGDDEAFAIAMFTKLFDANKIVGVE